MSIWTILAAVLIALALVVLFFPFVFKIDFEVSLAGASARLYFFKKLLKVFQKSFGKKNEDDEFGESSDNLDDADFAPTYVPPKKKTEPTKPVASVEEKRPAVEASAFAPETPKETLTTPKPDVALDVKSEVKTEEPKAEVKVVEEPAVAESVKPEPAEDKPKEKRTSLTDEEFWTIILTPDLDRTAFWGVKKWLVCLLKLFRVEFQDCFVEGIRSNPLQMGYLSAVNGFIKSYPYVGAWDLRMDWTCEHELRGAGHVRGTVNLCRILGLILATLFYGGIIAFKFWRRRAHVLKTGELPKLDWVRTKIVKFASEE